MIHSLLKFISLTHRFSQIKRRIYATGEDRWENNSEHSFQLALCAWYIIEAEKLPLRSGLAIQYALAHDLVELHAGDTFAFDTDTQKHITKKERELHAASMLAAEWPDFGGLHQIIQNYENLSDEESMFVYALDKLLPAANNYLNAGRAWKYHKLSLEQVRQLKEKQIPVSPFVWRSWQELYTLLQKDEETLFGEPHPPPHA